MLQRYGEEHIHVSRA